MRPIECGDSGLRRILRDTGELYPLWRSLKEADSQACKLESDKLMDDLKAFDQRILRVKESAEMKMISKLAINGYDLMENGVEAGPKMGEIIRALNEHIVDFPMDNTKELLLEHALKMWRI